MRVLVVDDHAIVRLGLKNLLCELPDTQVDGAQSGREALAHLECHPCDLVILDIGLPDRSGLEVLKDIRRLYPPLPVIVLTMYPEEQYAIRVLKAGAAGYLTKNSVPEELLDAVRRVAAGGRYLTTSLAERLAWAIAGEATGHDALTDREMQILCLLGSGKRVSEIARELGLSVKTVSSHRINILGKMRLRTTAELVHYAVRNGLSRT